MHIRGLNSAVRGYILKVDYSERVFVHIRGLISAVCGYTEGWWWREYKHYSCIFVD